MKRINNFQKSKNSSELSDATINVHSNPINLDKI